MLQSKKIETTRLLLYLYVCLCWMSSSEAGILKDVPQVLRQPNGMVIQCFASGDEFYNWLHDASGYTIIQDPETGYYCYATLVNGNLCASPHIVGQVSPQEADLTRGVHLGAAQIREKIRTMFPDWPKRGRAPTTGTVANLVFFVRFSDEDEFTEDLSVYDGLFNDSGAGKNSVYNYFQEISYSKLTVSSTFYPTVRETDLRATVKSHQDSNPRNYYRPYNVSTNPTGYKNFTERTQREHALVKSVIDTIGSQVPGTIDVDVDKDGYVDSVCLVVYGAVDGWNDLLWPHQWSLYTQTAYIQGKRVYDYDFNLQSYVQSSGVGVVSHELLHTLGFPDLYHYTSNGINPADMWDIMDSTLNPPQHPGSYMRYRYGNWIGSIPSITVSGVYTLNPLTSTTANCYQIASPYSTNEYFMVEYRRKTGIFENSLPGSGLLVYRINKNKDGSGNSEGPPDEVYVYRPGGTTTQDGQPTKAYFSSEALRTVMNDSTNPSSFLTDGSLGGLYLSEVGSAGTTISFRITLGIPRVPKNLTFTNIGTAQLTLNWTDDSDNESGFKIERKKPGGVYAQIATTGANVTQYNDTGLTEGTTYYYRMRAYNAVGDSPYSNEHNPTTLPAAPANLTASAISTSQIELSWNDNSQSESGFKLERGLSATSYSQIATLGANVTQYSDTALGANTTCYYRLCSYNNTGNSSYSNEANATTYYVPDGGGGGGGKGCGACGLELMLLCLALWVINGSRAAAAKFGVGRRKA